MSATLTLQRATTSQDLQQFLVGCRARLRPEDLGIPPKRGRGVWGHGLTQDHVAQRLGISSRHYRTLEQGRLQQPRVELLMRLAQVLRMTDAEQQLLLRYSLGLS